MQRGCTRKLGFSGLEHSGRHQSLANQALPKTEGTRDWLDPESPKQRFVLVCCSICHCVIR